MAEKKSPRAQHAAIDAATVEVFRRGFADGAAGVDPAVENDDSASADVYHEGYQQGGFAADKAIKKQKHDVYSRHSKSMRAVEFVGALAVAMKQIGNLPVVIKVGSTLLGSEQMSVIRGHDEDGNRAIVIALPARKKKL